jgi:hypothetical protein
VMVLIGGSCHYAMIYSAFSNASAWILRDCHVSTKTLGLTPYFARTQ